MHFVACTEFVGVAFKIKIAIGYSISPLQIGCFFCCWVNLQNTYIDWWNMHSYSNFFLLLLFSMFTLFFPRLIVSFPVFITNSSWQCPIWFSLVRYLLLAIYGLLLWYFQTTDCLWCPKGFSPNNFVLEWKNFIGLWEHWYPPQDYWKLIFIESFS